MWGMLFTVQWWLVDCAWDKRLPEASRTLIQYKQERLENQGGCVILTGEIKLNYHQVAFTVTKHKSLAAGLYWYCSSCMYVQGSICVVFTLNWTCHYIFPADSLLILCKGATLLLELQPLSYLRILNKLWHIVWILPSGLQLVVIFRNDWISKDIYI